MIITIEKSILYLKRVCEMKRKLCEDEKPPLSLGRLVGEILAGVVSGVVGGIGGSLVILIYS